MNKFELIESLKDTNSLSRAQAQKIVELVFSSMADTLAKGGRVEIRGLCSFFVKDYKGYTGRNPKTGDLVTVQSKRLPFFKPGKDLKNRVDR
jgi:integration host factor subunit beta